MKAIMGIVLCALLGASVVRAESVDQQFSIAGDNLHLVNLVGEIRVEAGSGPGFQVEVAIRGKDAGRDHIRIDQADGNDAHLYVQYPIEKDKTYIYPALGHDSNSSFSAPRGSGWGEDEEAGHGIFRSLRRQVRIESRGRGLEVWADVVVRVPAGGSLEVHHGAGNMTASGVQGDVLLDSAVGGVEVEATRGRVSVDTGSGDVQVRETEGDLVVDTGSGSVTLLKCRGKHLSADTGSGAVNADGIEADDLKVDTGSGDVSVTMARIGGGQFIIDTGSGSIRLKVPADASAEVRADTGSGDVTVDAANARMHHHEHDEVSLTFGNGDADITLDAGSGSIQITQ